MTFRNAVFEGVLDVVVDNFGGGSIAIEPTPQPGLVETSIDAADELFLDEVQVRQDQGQLRISCPPMFMRNGSAHLRLGVPAGLSFVVRASSADVSISADIGRSKIASGSGDVTVGVAADLDCSTGSGTISATRLEGAAAKLSTGSGDISVSAVRCPLSAKSGSGDVVVKSLHHADLQASSGSGDIAVPSATGSVDLRSASGSLTIGVADNLPAWLDLNSVSGDVRITLQAAGQPDPGEPYISLRARTASGDISIYRA